MRITSGLFGDQQYAWQVDLRLVTLALVALLAFFAVFAYNRRGGEPAPPGSASERLQPITTGPGNGVVRRTVYVPIYSSLYLGRQIKHDVVQLTSTLSVRNVSPRYPVVIESVRYYDSHGRPVRDHLPKPAELAALASVEFVVGEADTTGGPGANFLVKWSGPSGVDEPLIEAIMVGQSANVGISFTSAGHVVTNEPR